MSRKIPSLVQIVLETSNDYEYPSYYDDDTVSQDNLDNEYRDVILKYITSSEGLADAIMEAVHSHFRELPEESNIDHYISNIYDAIREEAPYLFEDEDFENIKQL